MRRLMLAAMLATGLPALGMADGLPLPPPRPPAWVAPSYQGGYQGHYEGQRPRPYIEDRGYVIPDRPLYVAPGRGVWREHPDPRFWNCNAPSNTHPGPYSCEPRR